MEVKEKTNCCASLYSEPKIYAQCFCDIEAGTEVIVGELDFTGKFYKVWTESGIEGWCLRHQIKLPKEEDDGREHT